MCVQGGDRFLLLSRRRRELRGCWSNEADKQTELIHLSLTTNLIRVGWSKKLTICSEELR